MKLLSEVIETSRNLIAKYRLGFKYKSSKIKLNLLKLQIYNQDEMHRKLY